MKSRVREFVDECLIPVERDFLQQQFSAVEPQLRKLREEARRRGLWAPHLPKALGGQGLALSEFAEVSEELGRTPIGHYSLNCNAPDIGNMELLLAHGSEDQRARWLAPLARGEIRSCFAMTEPDRAGSNPVWLDTRAERKDRRLHRRRAPAARG
jgi:alkylation response protein AidB-like acyl-CoA dehydrogenase